MCFVTSVHCPQCGLFQQDSLTLCDDIKEEHFSTEARYENPHYTSLILKCPDFVWPPPQSSTPLSQMCDDCLFIHDPYGHVREHATMQAPVTTLDEDGEEQESVTYTMPDNHWPARMSEIPHRRLTIRIPFCEICQEPRFFTTTDDDGKVKIGIEGVEMECNSVLQKWLTLLLQKEGVVIQIDTGFIHQTCPGCENLEMVLRGRVVNFLKECDRVTAWMVWNWLLLRGTGVVDFWTHECPNVGFPDQIPPAIARYLDLMSDGWKAKSGIPGKPNPPIVLPPLPLPIDAASLHHVEEVPENARPGYTNRITVPLSPNASGNDSDNSDDDPYSRGYKSGDWSLCFHGFMHLAKLKEPKAVIQIPLGVKANRPRAIQLE
ncbi:hypothetical protein M426DRAFT_10364 [Hypoxylon sp. CI-4A]|nr:hypothetical protein M426DRAFT_10364 [Hypoxylon sp. CI-4A]